MRGKAFLYALVIVIALIVAGVNFMLDTIVGCGSKLLSQFESHELAQVYARGMTEQLVAEGYTVNDTYWTIKRQGKGCVVEFNASARRQDYYKNTLVTGDQFFIDKADKHVYPQSEGASIFLKPYDGEISLTHSLQPAQPQAIPTQTRVVITPIPSPTPININCYFWTEISEKDVGKTRCVIGTILRKGPEKKYAQVIRFIDDPDVSIIGIENANLKVQPGDQIKIVGIIHRGYPGYSMNLHETTIEIISR